MIWGVLPPLFLVQHPYIRNSPFSFNFLPPPKKTPAWRQGWGTTGPAKVSPAAPWSHLAPQEQTQPSDLWLEVGPKGDEMNSKFPTEAEVHWGMDFKCLNYSAIWLSFFTFAYLHIIYLYNIYIYLEKVYSQTNKNRKIDGLKKTGPLFYCDTLCLPITQGSSEPLH